LTWKQSGCRALHNVRIKTPACAPHQDARLLRTQQSRLKIVVQRAISGARNDDALNRSTLTCLRTRRQQRLPLTCQQINQLTGDTRVAEDDLDARPAHQ
jgi:hypothetical protein